MMWTRNNQRHNDLTTAAKRNAARMFWIERMTPVFAEHCDHLFSLNDFLRETFEGRHDAMLSPHIKTLDAATRVHNSTQALMYLRGYHAPFDSKRPFESTRYYAAGGGSWTHGYLMRHSSYTRDEAHQRRHPGAHAPRRAYTFSEDGDVICGDPRGHKWVCSDEDENHVYCTRCGCTEY